MQELQKIVPVILSGGSGTRLWPLSRIDYPKQFLPLRTPELSLLQETILRVRAPYFLKPIVVSNVDHRFIVAEQLQQIACKADLILEPASRNTALALAVAALHAQACYGEEALVLAMPSDHVIEKEESFLEAVYYAATHMPQDAILTFGVRPISPETGYGYIQSGERLRASDLRRVLAFTEKPDSTRAKEYIARGGYYWNSGIFLFRAHALLSELKRHTPNILNIAKESLERATPDPDFIRLESESFERAESISIDYAVMEVTDKAVMLMIDCGWSDIGSWYSLSKLPKQMPLPFDHERQLPKDILYHDDIPLMSDYRCTEGIRNFVAKLRATTQAARIERPWGYYESLDEGSCYKVKFIHVNPGEKLSLQMHCYRAEHWVVVKGEATIICEGEKYILPQDHSFAIPAGRKHRLENAGSIPLEVIEVQVGTYLGEDDIFRFEDQYNRAD